jgi:acetylornithine deacetylase/succinyl-diaminopimelate desuccinylase-like protein
LRAGGNAVDAAVAAVLTSFVAEPLLTGFGADGYLLVVPACDGGFVARDLGVPTVVLGPGSVNDQAHRSDESVGVAELVVAARAYAVTAMRLLG